MTASTAHKAIAQGKLADVFRQRILTGRLQPGDRLREIPLAQEFGTSRGPIRDTFLRLSQEGLFEARPNAGVRVAQAPSVFKRKTLVQLRRTIECEALGFNFDAGIDPLLDTLSANLAAFEGACRGGAFEEVVLLDMAFHRSIVEAADEGSMLGTWLPVTLQMSLRYSRHRALVESFDEHKAIVVAIGRGDRKEAMSALRRHIV